MKKQRFISDMQALETIIKGNELKGIKTGPIVLGLYARLSSIFKKAITQ